MIDFWEAIGRLATYPRLNDEFLNVLPPAGSLSPVNVPVERYHTSSAGLDIPEDQYSAVQEFFDPLLTENYLSIMAAGELLMAYSYQEFRDAMKPLQDIVDHTNPKGFGPSTRYFITLGAVIIDSLFRHRLRDGEKVAVRFTRRLADREMERIKNLVNDPAFDAAADLLCKSPWSGGCTDFVTLWPGYLQPIAVTKGVWADTDAWKTKTDSDMLTAAAGYHK